MTENPNNKSAILKERLWTLDQLASNDRQAKLQAAFRECASASKSSREGQPPYIPLMARPGVRDSKALQEEIVCIGGEFTDMFLVQLQLHFDLAECLKHRRQAWNELGRAMQDLKGDEAKLAPYKEAYTKADTDYRRVDYLDQLSEKELLEWANDAAKGLGNYAKEIDTYMGTAPAAHSKEMEKPSYRLLGVIARLSIRDATQKVMGMPLYDYELELPDKYNVPQVIEAYMRAINIFRGKKWDVDQFTILHSAGSNNAHHPMAK